MELSETVNPPTLVQICSAVLAKHPLVLAEPNTSTYWPRLRRDFSLPQPVAEQLFAAFYSTTKCFSETALLNFFTDSQATPISHLNLRGSHLSDEFCAELIRAHREHLILLDVADCRNLTDKFNQKLQRKLRLPGAEELDLPNLLILDCGNLLRLWGKWEPQSGSENVTSPSTYAEAELMEFEPDDERQDLDTAMDIAGDDSFDRTQDSSASVSSGNRRGISKILLIF